MEVQYNDYADIISSVKTLQINDYKTESYEEENCKHENIKTFEGGRGYCMDCAIYFEDVNVIRQAGEECKHEDYCEDDNGINICRKCGFEVTVYNTNPEWRVYRQSDNQASKDPSRCHQTKKVDNGLSDVFKKYNIDIDQQMLRAIEYKYYKICPDAADADKGKDRVAIVAECFLNVCAEFKQYKPSDYVREKFGKLTKRKMSIAQNKYRAHFEPVELTAECLLHYYCPIIGIKVGTNHFKKVSLIAAYLKGTAPEFQRSTPQAVAAAIIYFYLCMNTSFKDELGLNKSTFAAKVGLSDITITKLVEKIIEVSQVKDIKM